MDITYIRIMSVAGLLAVGLVAIVGGVVVSWLADRLARFSHTLGARVADPDRASGPRFAPGAEPGTDQGLGLDPGVHDLLARQAWWRLRC
jgi:hypothetical protein